MENRCSSQEMNGDLMDVDDDPMDIDVDTMDIDVDPMDIDLEPTGGSSGAYLASRSVPDPRSRICACAVFILNSWGPRHNISVSQWKEA